MCEMFLDSCQTLPYRVFFFQTGAQPPPPAGDSSRLCRHKWRILNEPGSFEANSSTGFRREHIRKLAVVSAGKPGAGHDTAALSVSAAAALSFLKQTRGMLTWTAKDLQTSLLVTPAQAQQILGAFELQGYVKKSEEAPAEWLTTLNGEAVSGAKPPRFSRESVEKSLAALRARMAQANQDRDAPYTVAQALAFGDFQTSAAQVQPADVGIRLLPRTSREGQRASPRGAKSAAEFLRRLRARDPKLTLIRYEPWMSARAHLNLLAAQRAENTAASSKLKNGRKPR